MVLGDPKKDTPISNTEPAGPDKTVEWKGTASADPGGKHQTQQVGQLHRENEPQHWPDNACQHCVEMLRQ